MAAPGAPRSRLEGEERSPTATVAAYLRTCGSEVAICHSLRTQLD